jgi:hypothetical protein
MIHLRFIIIITIFYHLFDNSLIDESLLHDYFDKVVQFVIVSHFDLFYEQCNKIHDY